MSVPSTTPLSPPWCHGTVPRGLTHVAEEDGEEDEAVRQAGEGDDEVEAEEEDLDELCLGEGQHHDARQVGHGHPGHHLRPPQGQSS